MRISDWSSDVCSSDLHFGGEVVQRALVGAADIHAGAAADRLEPFQYLDRRGVVITGGRGRGSEQVVGHDDAIRAGESGAQAGAGYGFINAARIHSRDGGYVRSDLRAAQADARRIRRLPARPRSEERRVGKEGVRTCNTRGVQ